MKSTDELHARYWYLYAKHLVVDRDITLVLLGNIDLTDTPLQGARGNQGGGQCKVPALPNTSAKYLPLTGFIKSTLMFLEQKPLPDTWKEEDIARPVPSAHRVQCRGHTIGITGHKQPHPSSDTKCRDKMTSSKRTSFC